MNKTPGAASFISSSETTEKRLRDKNVLDTDAFIAKGAKLEKKRKNV